VKERDLVQMIRLADVFLVGPLMIYGAAQIDKPIIRDLLLLSGLATIMYNGGKYLLVSKQ